MLRQYRELIVQALWQRYRKESVQAQAIEAGLQQLNISPLTLDHFAVIDLPGPNTGIEKCSKFFQT